MFSPDVNGSVSPPSSGLANPASVPETLFNNGAGGVI
jgi:hypothetical protein